MTRATLTKILILVILAFIICLPEFFSLHRVSRVNFLCLPYRRCERGNQVEKGEIKSEHMCDPSRTAEREKWQQACTHGNHVNMTGPASDSRRGSDDSQKSLFVCQTDMDMAEVHSNISSAARDLKLHLEVSVELRLGEAETLNLTLYGRSNHSSLDLHPPEEQGEEEDEKKKKKKKGDEGQRAFYCCLPVLPASSESANPSRCLLWLANQTVSAATAKGKLPWKRTQKAEWQCLYRVLWLALLCVVLLTAATSVLRNIYRRRRKKPMVRPVHNFPGQQYNDQQTRTETFTHTELSPIREADSKEDIETLMDGNVSHCYTANLHHRGHPSISSLTEEQPEERSIDMDNK